MTVDRGMAPYLPFDGGRFRLMMGLMPLPVGEWIELGGTLQSDLAAKRELLETRHDEVFAALPEGDAAARELLELLARHLPCHHAETFHRQGDHLVNAATGESWDLAHPPLHPLDLAGRLVPEDLCILQADDASFRLVAASVCSPARWRLSEKIGRPLGAIHDPVPGYAERLQRPVDRFFASIKPEKPVWRLNWGIVDDPAPFQPVARPRPTAVTAENAGERLWLRVERQTMRRLPATEAVVFTIRTYVTRLDAAIRSGDTAAELAAIIRDMPEAMRQYKQIAPMAPALLAWLDRLAEGGPRGDGASARGG
jgi:hypothetical protein